MTSCSTQLDSTTNSPPQLARTISRIRNGDPIRVAVVGCGAIAEQMHLPVLAGHEGVKLIAMVDRDVQRVTKLAKGYRVQKVLADAGELNTNLIDAAIIATPPFHHAPCAIDLMRRGIHVLVEKPMALNLAEAETMVETAESQQVALSVGFFRRLNPSIRIMKSLLDSHWLGRPIGFAVEGGGMYSWGAATLGSMRKDLAGGGVLIDFGSHMLDLLFFLVDEPSEVLEYRDNSLGGVEADCSIRLRVCHQGHGVDGTVQLARTRKLGNLIRFECERGILEFDITERFRIKVTPSKLELIDSFRGEARPYWMDAGWCGDDESLSWYETFRAEIDDWLEAIASGTEPRLSGRSALPTVRLIDECYRRRLLMLEPWVVEGLERRDEKAVIGQLSENIVSQPLADTGQSPAIDIVSDHPLARNTATAHCSPLTSDRRRVLITGATGFIGCRVAEILHLRDGWDVRAVVHNPGNASRLARLPVEMVQADLQSSEAVERLVEGCDAVVHCAIGTAWGQRREIFAVTVDGTQRLADAALAAGVRRFVHLSTMSVYGDDSQLTGILDEATPVRPTPGSEYGESKAAAERAVLRAVQEGLSAVILRPARVYGPYSRIFIVRPIEAMAEGRFHWLGAPDVPADVLYVDNLVEAITRSLQSADHSIRGEVFTISDGDSITWRQFYEYFAHGLGLKLHEVPVDEPARATKQGAFGRMMDWPGAWCRGVKGVVTSPEFRSLGRRVLETDTVGSLPRWALERFPGIERTVRRIVKADGSLPIYRRTLAAATDTVVMGSGGAVVSIDKARRILSYEPTVPRDRAMELTLKWVKHARVI